MVPSADDPDLTELLATRAPARASTPTPAPAGADGLLPAGARLKRYRIEAVLGRGGMGDVYRAEQLEPVCRTVALKLLRAHKLGARELAYFEVERQVLAQMRHPAIAQIYDADTTADGHPFFAMEFIAGSPITHWCDAHALPLVQRLELFIRVCEGVQHAHQKGVVHRDLKPGNLLVDDVDGRPLPKIIDFGIATAAAPTAAREVAGTPEYMSPEQAGDDQALVDTRSDVYALGVVLGELLTGQRPSSGGATVTAAARTLRLPSQQLDTLAPADAQRLARGRGQPLARMRRLLRDELDWVVAKAMRHERHERYASAAALADDLRRFIAGSPLQAVPPSRRYALRKFAHRHRIGIAAGSLVALALVAGLALSVYGLLQAREQRAIAERRNAQLEKVAAFQQSMLQGIDIEAMGIGVAGGLREQLARHDSDALPALERALARASTADLARALVGRDILANAERAITRDFAAEPALAADLRESVAHVRAALGMPKAAAADFAQVADYRAHALGAAAEATLKARLAQAEALLDAAQPRPALALAQTALHDAAALPAEAALRLRLRVAQARALAALGERQQARALLEAARADGIRLRGQGDAATLAASSELAELLGRMGEAQAGRALMEAVMEALVPMRQAQGGDDAQTLGAQHTLAVLRRMTGDMSGAIALQQQLVDTRTRRLGAEHPTTLDERGNLATMFIDNGQLAQALPVNEAVVGARTRVLGAEHPQTLRSKLNLATNHARLKHFDAAIALQAEVADARTRLLGPNHPDTLFIQLNRAATLYQAGRPKEALALLERQLPPAQAVLGDRHPQLHMGYDIRAQAAEQTGDTALALASARELLRLREAALGADDVRTVDAAWQLEGLLRTQRQQRAADALRRRYVLPLLEAPEDTLRADQRAKRQDIIKTEREEAARARSLGVSTSRAPGASSATPRAPGAGS